MIEFNEGKGKKKFIVDANYRKTGKPNEYIVHADNARQAKLIFKAICSWLDVYSVKEFEEENIE